MDEEKLRCPKCPSATLEEAKAGDISVSRCGECGGIWFDFSELETVLKVSTGLTKIDRRPVDPEKNQMKANCPVCKTPMIKLHAIGNSAVIMDGCKVCYGRWLDGGELSRLKGNGFLAKLKNLFG